MSITIRPATPTDAPEILRLNHAHNDARDNVEGIAARIASCPPLETLYLAEQAGRVLGYITLRLLPQICDPIPYAEVWELYIDASYRRQGVGQQLMAHVEALAQAAGATQLVLVTSMKNQNAQHFYRAAGYDQPYLSFRKKLGEEPATEAA